MRYHAGHVWKILGGLGWSPRRPVGRARERNEQAIRSWKKKTWPAIKKSPAGRAPDRLPRRKRMEPAPALLPHLGATGADASTELHLQWEDAVGGGRLTAAGWCESSSQRWKATSPWSTCRRTPGAGPGGIPLELLETTRAAECLSTRLLGRPARPAGAAPHAPPTTVDYRLLDAGKTVARMTLYYARLNRAFRVLSRGGS